MKIADPHTHQYTESGYRVRTGKPVAPQSAFRRFLNWSAMKSGRDYFLLGLGLVFGASTAWVWTQIYYINNFLLN